MICTQTLIWAYCDGEECPLEGAAALGGDDWDIKLDGSRVEFRKALRAEGWLVKGNLTYCPSCKPAPTSSSGVHLSE